MRKSGKWVILILVLTVLLAGCMKDGSQTDPTEAPTTPVTQPANPAPTAPAPTEPAPTAPTDPTPTEPAPTAPTDPTPTVPVLSKIVLETLPKTQYYVGEALDTRGGVILCEYTDGTVTRVNLTNSDVSGFAEIRAPGTYELTVRYKENGVIAQISYTITVLEPPKPTPVLKAISLETLPKTQYYVGEALDTRGGVILREYTDGTVTRVNLTNSDVSGFAEIRAPGTYELTVRYAEKGILAQTTYTIIVSSKA